jgi:hypothetical protein
LREYWQFFCSFEGHYPNESLEEHYQLCGTLKRICRLYPIKWLSYKESVINALIEKNSIQALKIIFTCFLKQQLKLLLDLKFNNNIPYYIKNYTSTNVNSFIFAFYYVFFFFFFFFLLFLNIYSSRVEGYFEDHVFICVFSSRSLGKLVTIMLLPVPYLTASNVSIFQSVCAKNL